jgi:hypothetical protein
LRKFIKLYQRKRVAIKSLLSSVAFKPHYQIASQHIIDHISGLYFLLPSSTSDVIVQYGLNANSPEAASKRELSHLTVQNEGSRKNSKTVRGAFF